MKKLFVVFRDCFVAFLFLVTLNFLLPRLLPGDPIASLAGEQALFDMTPQIRQELAMEYGLNEPIHMQFFKYIGNLIELDFGYSYYYKANVSEIIISYIPWTFILVFTSMIIAIVIGYRVGIHSGYNAGKIIDKLLLSVMIFISGFPQFFIGMIFLILFSIELNWLPIGGAETSCSGLQGIERLKDILIHMVLPVMTLAISKIPSIYLLVRNTSIKTRERQFIRTGLAKGLSDKTIKHKYVGRNSFIPLLTMCAIDIGRMFVGALLVEVVFSYPGLGTLIYESIKVRDYPVLQGVFFIVSIMVLVFNGISELINYKYGGVKNET